MASTTVSNAGPVSVTTVTSHGAETRPVELNEAAVQDMHAKLAMMLMSACWTPAAALRVVVELNIPHILATQAPAPKHTLTSEEILQHVADATKPNARNLERTMRLLTCKSVFSEDVEYSAQGEQQVVVRRYGLTPLSRVLVPGHSTGSVANFVKFATVGPVYGKALAHLSESVLLGEDAFELAYGMNEFEYMHSHPEHLSVFQAAMTDHANQMLPLLLAKYQGFKTVRKLMDVGGGEGTILARILARHPHIQGVNFDLPEVVATNPRHRGVEHQGGNMFDSIPSGCDAIFMKSIMHDWNDEDCLKILQNCYKALPVGGKVILVDAIVPLETPKDSEALENVGIFASDFVMQVHCPDGRERHQYEFQHLVTAAGFSHFQVVVQLDYMFVMEGLKQ